LDAASRASVPRFHLRHRCDQTMTACEIVTSERPFVVVGPLAVDIVVRDRRAVALAGEYRSRAVALSANSYRGVVPWVIDMFDPAFHGSIDLAVFDDAPPWFAWRAHVCR
jgi:hypothetical protein